MKKIIIVVLVIAVLGTAAVIFNRNILARFIIVRGIKQVCGLEVTIGKLDIGLPDVTITGLKIYNPAGFTDRLMADIPEIYLDFDLPAFFKNKIHMGKIRLEVRELDLILNERGKLNVNSLGLLLPKKGTGKPPQIQIDELVLRIGKVVYKELLPGSGPGSGEFDFNFNETFRNVTDPSEITAQVLQKALLRTGINKLADAGPAGEQAQQALEGLKALFTPAEK